MKTLLLSALLALLAAPAGAAGKMAAFGPDSLAGIEAKRTGKPFVLVVWSYDCVYCKATLEMLAR